jgi:hypothetical protein
MQGFEPWTSRSQGERATKLRYIPSLCKFDKIKMVGMQGFEPWTSRSRSVRATKLRYIPII